MKTEATPTKTEFKFNCQTCGQHILVATDWVGLAMSCPSCQTRITIPSPPGSESSSTRGTPSQPGKPTIRIELPPKTEQAAAGSNIQPNASPTSAPVAPASVTGHEPWSELVQHLEKGALVEPAVLATALFRELTSVRNRLKEVERKLAEQPANSGESGAATKPATVSAGN